VGKRADENRVEVLRNRDPITFLQRRSEASAHRSAAGAGCAARPYRGGQAAAEPTA
jgi:hypothetical protein